MARDRHAPLRQLDRLHRHRRRWLVPDHREVPGRDRDHGHVPRGDQRQRGVLRGQPVGAAHRGHTDRVGPRGPDGLDDRPAHPARLAGGHRQGEHAELRRPTSARHYVGRSFDPDTKFAAPWQSGMTGLGFDQNATGPQDSLAVFFSDAVRGQDDVPQRDARHDRPDGALPGRRSRHDHRRRSSMPPWPRSMTPSSPASSARSPATRTSSSMAGGDVSPGDGLVGRHPRPARPRPDRGAGLPVGPRQRGRDALDGQHGDPLGTPNKVAAEKWIDFYYDPVNAAAIEAYVNYVCPVVGPAKVMLEMDPELADNPLIFPPAGLDRPSPPVPCDDRRRGDGLGRGVHQGHGPLAGDAPGDRASGRSRRTRCCAPGLLWLAVFYVYPAVQMFLVSLWTGNVNDGFEQTWNWGIYPQAVQEYWPWIARSIVYGGLATILAFALGLPARLRDRVPRGRLQEPAAVHGHRAVLHELPAADHLVEDHPVGQRDHAGAAEGHRARARPTSSCWPRRRR